MAVTLRGKGIVWGCHGFTFTGIIDSATSHTADFQSISLTRDSDAAYVQDRLGEDVSAVYKNIKRVARISVIPSSTSAISVAQTSLNGWLPAPGSVVTVVDATATWMSNTGTETYNVLSGTVNQSNNQAAGADLEIETREANDITAAIS